MSNIINPEIILVEDNPHDAELFVRILNKSNADARTVICEDGEAVLNYLYSKGVYQGLPLPVMVKVIFLDLKMPKINGHEVLKVLRSDDRTRKIPVVVVSSSAEAADIELSYLNGANSYVVKPVGYDEYASVIQTVCTYWLKTNKFA